MLKKINFKGTFIALWLTALSFMAVFNFKHNLWDAEQQSTLLEQRQHAIAEHQLFKQFNEYVKGRLDSNSCR